MILVDTGPLVALIDARDALHGTCVDVIKAARRSLLTTWPCLTESLHLLGRAGPAGQAALWTLVERREVRVADQLEPSLARIRELMVQYADRPMDLADASLVELAEASGIRRIFSLDGDFRIYRMAGGKRFEVVP